jgi:peptide/nickel transport system substrate-binding protein
MRRIILTLFVPVIAFAMALSGCNFSSGSDEADGTITIATRDDLLDADNVTLGGTANDRTIMGSTVYDALFTTDRDGNAAPALAKEATSSPDAKGWTMTLQEGVKFSNGKDFTANDVKANFDAFMNPDNASTYLPNLANVDSIEVVDDHAIAFNLKTPDARFPEQMMDTMYIADLDARKTPGGTLEPGEVPIGTGPYKWRSRQEGTSLTFEKNADYWRGEPPLQTAEFKVIHEPEQAALALETGEADVIVNNVPVQSLPKLREDPNIQVLHAEGSYFFQGYMNFEKARRGGYGDPDKVHQGLAYLANAQAIIPPLIGDFGSLATQPIASWQLGYSDKVQPFEYDEAKGVQLLAEGGINKGDPIRLLAGGSRPYLCEWATDTQSNLKRLGYDAQLQCLANEVIPAETTKYEWDMLFWTTSGRATAATMYEQRWGMDLTLPEPDDTYTLRDPELQTLIDKMRATLDDREYAELGGQIAERIVRTDTAVVPGYFQDVYILARSNVKGLVASPTQYYGLLYNAMDKVTMDAPTSS